METIPNEIIYDILFLCDYRGILALGLTCTRLNEMASDKRLWEKLFDRDFSYLYKNLQDWPRVNMLPDHIIETYNVSPTLAGIFRLDSVSSFLPLPLVGLMLIGKDMKWIYVQHTRALISYTHEIKDIMKPPSLLNMKETDLSAANRTSLTPISIYIGDRDLGFRQGYGLHIKNSDDRISAWIVSDWDEDDRTYGRSKFMFADLEKISIRNINPYIEATYIWGEFSWRIKNPRVTIKHDHRVDITRRFYKQNDENYEQMSTDIFTGIYPLGGKTKQRDGNAMIKFHNGDICVQKWTEGKLTNIVSFNFSDRCDDSRFADKWFIGGDWKIYNYDIGNGWCDNAYWTNDNSDCSKLFREYITSRKIGWSKTSIDYAIKEIQKLNL